MTKTQEPTSKEFIRQQIYALIDETGAKLTNSQHESLKRLILAHDEVPAKKALTAIKKINFTKGKIYHYLDKIKKVPLITDKIRGNKETLRQVLLWLDSDAE